MNRGAKGGVTDFPPCGEFFNYPGVLDLFIFLKKRETCGASELMKGIFKMRMCLTICFTCFLD